MGFKARTKRHRWRSEQPGLLFAAELVERCEDCGLRRKQVKRARKQSVTNVWTSRFVWEWGYTDDMCKDRFVVGDGLVPPCKVRP